jgi:hypothetical protein
MQMHEVPNPSYNIIYILYTIIEVNPLIFATTFCR